MLNEGGDLLEALGKGVGGETGEFAAALLEELSDFLEDLAKCISKR